MAEKKREGQRPAAARAKQPEQSRRRLPLQILMRLLAILVSLVFILAAVAIIVYRDTITLDSLVRRITYHDIARDEHGAAASFDFSGGANEAYALVGEDLLLCTNNEIRLYSVSGKVLLEKSVSIHNPAVHVVNGMAVVYDLGGHELYVVKDREIAFHQTNNNRFKLLSARLNVNGWMCVVEEAAGYKADVTVYNAEFEGVVREQISSAFVVDAVVSPDNKRLALAMANQDSASFLSRVCTYDCSNGEKLQEFRLGDTMVLDLDWKDKVLRLQRENGLTVLGNGDHLNGTWSDDSQYLQSYAITGLDYSVQLMGKYRAGSMGRLMIIDNNGEEYASMSIKEEVLSVSAAERYIAVLTANRLMILTKDLTTYATTENVGATKALMRADGSVMLIGNGSAHLYVPN